jgi:hypothetical protein
MAKQRALTEKVVQRLAAVDPHQGRARFPLTMSCVPCSHRRQVHVDEASIQCILEGL